MVKTSAKVLGAVLLLYLMTVLTHGYWLPLAAEVLLIHNPPRKTEAMVVSTGSYARFRFALTLMLEGRAEKLLVLGDRRIATPIPGKSILDFAEEEAAAEGLSRQRLFLEHSTSTLVDARVAQKLMQSEGFNTAAVISDSYNMRRVAMIFDYVFRNSTVELHYVSAGFEKNEVHPERWWENPREFKYVVMEWIKIPLDFFRIHFLSS